MPAAFQSYGSRPFQSDKTTASSSEAASTVTTANFRTINIADMATPAGLHWMWADFAPWAPNSGLVPGAFAWPGPPKQTGPAGPVSWTELIDQASSALTRFT